MLVILNKTLKMKANVFKSIAVAIFIISFFTFFLPNVNSGCDSTKPLERPNLFQIDYKDGSATLYFTPVKDQITDYQIVYGTKLHQEDFGIIFKSQFKEGVISYTINYLMPNITYYFRVRAVNNCRFGLFSSTMKISTSENKTFYNNDGKNQFNNSKKQNFLIPTPVNTVYPEYNVRKTNDNIQQDKFITPLNKKKITFKEYLEYLLNLLFAKFDKLR